MKGDFSRIRFDAANRFSRVLQQQGRVMLDAEANEQTDILLHYLRTLARDLIGDYGGPLAEGGFALAMDEDRLTIGAGRYYVHGILVESDGTEHYAAQRDFPLLAPGANDTDDPFAKFLTSTTPNNDNWWLYLDVWERHVTALEDSRLREVALGGPDTCTRTRVVWQVKARRLGDISASLDKRKKALEERIKKIEDAKGDASVERAQLARVERAIERLGNGPGANACAEPIVDLEAPTGRMSAKLIKDVQPKTPCIIAPDARYRGAENQLYRVEIHRGGKAGDATFKWSRDNGSVAASVVDIDGDRIRVADARAFHAPAWVELADDTRVLTGKPGVFVRVVRVEDDTLIIDAASTGAADGFVVDPARHPVARQWDHDGDGLANGIALLGANTSDWRSLEDGVQVRFEADEEYQAGDYWLIPARVAGGANGGIEWPQPESLEAPRRAEHHYAPLGWVAWTTTTAGAAGHIDVMQSCLCTLRPLTPCQDRSAAVDRRDASGGTTTGRSRRGKP